MRLHKLPKNVTKKSKRRGRGYGSGKGGHTVGKGQKGQQARSGFKKLKGWIRESKVRSIPKLRGIGKRSFKKNPSKENIRNIVLNVKDLNSFKNGEVVDEQSLRQKGIIKIRSKRVEVKILGDGVLDKKLTIRGIKLSKQAEEKIKKAGGQILD
jgi:large subunit ribosomal protein L15